MKKIAIVITTLSYGGAQTMISELVRHISKEEFTLKIFVLKNSLGTRIEQEIAESGVECQYLSMKQGGRLTSKIATLLQLFCSLGKFNPDVVHGHLDTFYAPVYCLLRGVPFIFTVHSFPNRILHTKFKILLEQLRKKNLLRIVGCAKCVTEEMVRELGPLYGKICDTIYNPISLDGYKLDLGQRKRNKFVHVGRLEPIKNQMLILRAFRRLHEISPDSVLIVVGDGPLMGDYVKYVEHYHLDECIFFLGNREDVSDILKKCDFFVLSSNSECCPMSILEAMASGLPIISTDVGGVKEVVGDCGLLYDVGSEDGLFEAMKTVYQRPETVKKMIKEIPKLINKFDVRCVIPQYEQEYFKCVDEKNKSGRFRS